MKPINKFVPFEKLRKGDFVRAMGSPSGLIGYTSTGDIQWLGNAEGLRNNSNIDEFDKDTKFIIHGANIDQGSSGGPLFDADGGIIGLNTMISDCCRKCCCICRSYQGFTIWKLVSKKYLNKKNFFYYFFFQLYLFSAQLI